MADVENPFAGSFAARNSWVSQSGQKMISSSSGYAPITGLPAPQLGGKRGRGAASYVTHVAGLAASGGVSYVARQWNSAAAAEKLANKAATAAASAAYSYTSSKRSKGGQRDAPFKRKCGAKAGQYKSGKRGTNPRATYAGNFAQQYPVYGQGRRAAPRKRNMTGRQMYKKRYNRRKPAYVLKY
jgi:hypothetical protein